jgi:hypothetical protein
LVAHHLGIEAARQVSLERFRTMLGMLDHFGILLIAARANPAHRLFSIGEHAAMAIQCRRWFLFAMQEKHGTSGFRDSLCAGG